MKNDTNVTEQEISLSQQDLTRLFGKYLGCNVILDSDDIKGVFRLIEISGSNVGAKAVSTNTIVANIDNFKLFLTPLSKITDNDATTIAIAAGFLEQSFGKEGMI